MPANKDSRAIDPGDDLRPEYDLDYSRSRPNRFATGRSDTVVAVTLDPDVAAVFDTSDSVNRALRSVISTRSADNPTASRGAGRRQRR